MSEYTYSLLVQTPANGRYHLCDDITAGRDATKAQIRDEIVRDWAVGKGINAATTTVLSCSIDPA